MLPINFAFVRREGAFFLQFVQSREHDVGSRRRRTSNWQINIFGQFAHQVAEFFCRVASRAVERKSVLPCIERVNRRRAEHVVGMIFKVLVEFHVLRLAGFVRHRNFLDVLPSLRVFGWNFRVETLLENHNVGRYLRVGVFLKCLARQLERRN